MNSMANADPLKLNCRIVASIGKNPISSAAKARELGADILEVRTDLINEDSTPILEELKKSGLTLILTNRMKQEGGAWAGNEEERIRKMISELPLVDAVDIELCAEDKESVIQEAKNCGKTVVISSHDFKRTPDNDVMIRLIRESLSAGADIAKLAVMPRSLEDVLRLLEVTLLFKGKVCTIAMGDTGKHSRVIAPIYGSLLTYGYIDTPTAPGQLRVDELKYILGKLGY